MSDKKRGRVHLSKATFARTTFVRSRPERERKKDGSIGNLS